MHMRTRGLSSHCASGVADRSLELGPWDPFREEVCEHAVGERDSAVPKERLEEAHAEVVLSNVVKCALDMGVVPIPDDWSSIGLNGDEVSVCVGCASTSTFDVLDIVVR